MNDEKTKYYGLTPEGAITALILGFLVYGVGVLIMYSIAMRAVGG